MTESSPLPTSSGETISPEQTRQVVQQVAQSLAETGSPALFAIGRIVRQIGRERTLAFLQQALEVEAQGGLTTRDGSRRRTPGGVFFRLVRDGVSSGDRRIIWPPPGRPGRKPAAEPPAAPPLPAANPPWSYDQTISFLAGRMTDPAEIAKGAATVKVTLTGRPGRMIDVPSQQFVAIILEGKVPATLPKGLPGLPATLKPTYVVYISRKHWGKVADALQSSPEDLLIVEGFPLYDTRLNAFIVYATHVTTRLLQAASQPALSSSDPAIVTRSAAQPTPPPVSESSELSPVKPAVPAAG